MTDKPGGDAALKRGCTCPVMDNNHGTYPPYPPNGWWISPDCPLHGPNRKKDDYGL